MHLLTCESVTIKQLLHGKQTNVLSYLQLDLISLFTRHVTSERMKVFQSLWQVHLPRPQIFLKFVSPSAQCETSLLCGFPF